MNTMEDGSIRRTFSEARQFYVSERLAMLSKERIILYEEESAIAMKRREIEREITQIHVELEELRQIHETINIRY
jgi:hypothetical protein|tara:strand:+ start:560 stop:784 length:225 start_codon:yes stop_codon:yes gene_type:complete